jgi:hypothetical protein
MSLNPRPPKRKNNLHRIRPLMAVVTICITHVTTSKPLILPIQNISMYLMLPKIRREFRGRIKYNDNDNYLYHPMLPTQNVFMVLMQPEIRTESLHIVTLMSIVFLCANQLITLKCLFMTIHNVSICLLFLKTTDTPIYSISP